MVVPPISYSRRHDNWKYGYSHLPALVNIELMEELHKNLRQMGPWKVQVQKTTDGFKGGFLGVSQQIMG